MGVATVFNSLVLCHDQVHDTQNPCHDNVTGVFSWFVMTVTTTVTSLSWDVSELIFEGAIA